MRDVWYSSSYLLDRKQSMNGCAKKRFENYKMQPLDLVFRPEFKGKLSQYGLDPNRRTPTGIRAAIIREKGTNGEREMAYSLYPCRLRCERRNHDPTSSADVKRWKT